VEERFCLTTIAGRGVSLAGFSALLTLRAGQVWDAVALWGAPEIVRTSALDEFKTRPTHQARSSRRRAVSLLGRTRAPGPVPLRRSHARRPRR
jgi:hypothetical protein